MSKLRDIAWIIAAALVLLAHVPRKVDSYPSNGIRERIIADIERIMKCRHVPGMSISVLHKDREIISKGFGYSDIEANTTVTENSLFVIASMSKMFTATLIGIMLGRNQRRFPSGFDTLVVDIMGPDFAMSDEIRTKHATVKDVLAHRLGIPGYNWPQIMAMDSTRSIQEYCKRFKYLEPLKNSFREKFRYNNIMYVLAHCIAEKLGRNKSFASLLHENIFEPLNMTSSTTVGTLLHNNRNNFSKTYGEDGNRFLRDGGNEWKNLSKIYYMNDTNQEIKEISFDVIRSVEKFLEAAGGIVSTAADMKQWMTMQLHEGKLPNGTDLMPAKYWRDMFVPQIQMTSASMEVEPLFPILDSIDHVGLGWMGGYYRGYAKRIHEGRLSGFESKLTILPRMGIAVFTISNGPQIHGTYFNRVIHFVVLDAILNATSFLTNSTACTYPQPWLPKRTIIPGPTLDYSYETNKSTTKSIDNLALDLVNVSANGATKRSIFSNTSYTKYEGTYGHPLFGNITITYNATVQQLHFKSGLIGKGRLGRNNMTWYLDFTDALWYYNRIHDNRNTVIRLEFQGRNKADQFVQIRAVGFEALAPPIFVRNLRWDGGFNRPSVASSSLGVNEKSNQAVGLFVVSVLFCFVTRT